MHHITDQRILTEHLLCVVPHTVYKEIVQELKDYSTGSWWKGHIHEVYRVLSGNTVLWNYVKMEVSKQYQWNVYKGIKWMREYYKLKTIYIIIFLL